MADLWKEMQFECTLACSLQESAVSPAFCGSAGVRGPLPCTVAMEGKMIWNTGDSYRCVDMCCFLQGRTFLFNKRLITMMTARYLSLVQ